MYPICTYPVRARPECTLIYIKYIPIMYIPTRLHPQLLRLNPQLHLFSINKNNLHRLYTNNCTHPVYTLTLYPDNAPVLFIPWYSAMTTSMFVHDLYYTDTLPKDHQRLYPPVYNVALFSEYIHNSTVLYIPWRCTPPTSTSVPLCFYTEHSTKSTPTSPPWHSIKTTFTPRTSKLDYIHSTKTTFMSVSVLYIPWHSTLIASISVPVPYLPYHCIQTTSTFVPVFYLPWDSIQTTSTCVHIFLHIEGERTHDLYKSNSKMIDDWKIPFQMDCVLTYNFFSFYFFYILFFFLIKGDNTYLKFSN